MKYDVIIVGAGILGCLAARELMKYKLDVLVGPTSYNARSYKCTETTQEGIDHITNVAKKILPEIDMGTVIASFAGIRANIENVPKEEKDFVVRLSAERFVSALGIKNPGMTASPYLVEKIIELLQDAGLKCEADKKFDPIYRAKPLFLKASPEIQAQLLAENPAYGNAVCRCEGIEIGRQVAAYLGKGTHDLFPGISGRNPELTGRRGNMICTVCPKGCIMQVERVPFSVSGNQCDRGEFFAEQELESPKRVVTAIVKAGDSIVPVRTDRPVDKADIFKVMKAVKRVKTGTPVVPGQVVASDIAGTGADLVATWYA